MDDETTNRALASGNGAVQYDTHTEDTLLLGLITRRLHWS